MDISSDIVYSLYENMTEQKIISAYHGEFTQDVINMLLRQAKWDLNHRKVEVKTVKKTYGILVECLENILKHTSIINKNRLTKVAKEGIILFSQNEKGYVVTVGNLIQNDNVESLKNKIDYVNSLDRIGLREQYEHILRNGSISEKGGAGLGIIDIALKSGEKLGHVYKPYDQEFSFFALQVTISSTAGAN